MCRPGTPLCSGRTGRWGRSSSLLVALAVYQGPEQVGCAHDAGHPAGRALWGLGHGVPEAAQPELAEALLALLERPDPGPHAERIAALVRGYGTPEQVARLPR